MVNQHFPVHGNWQGLSLGLTLTGWLTHILSQADHRLNQVQDWASRHLETLSGGLGTAVRARDFSDDRLAAVLDLLGDDDRWASFQMALNQRTLRVYAWTPEQVRIDSTTASGYWQITPQGLFQLGHSKDHRPDLPQLKVVLATRDPLGMPLVTQVVAGHQADDPPYLPAIAQVRAGVEQRGLLDVGDSKMLAVHTRAYLQAGGDFYLGPLSAVRVPSALLEAYLQPVWDGQQPLTCVQRQTAEGQLETIAEGYETQVTVSAPGAGQTVLWVEQRWVVRSLAQAEQALRGLNERKPGKKRLDDASAVQQAVAAILDAHRVAGLLEVHIQEHTQQRAVRRYGDRPAQTRVERQSVISVQRNPAAVEQAIRGLGLQVFQEISLSIVTLGVQVHRHITPLSDRQRRILDLLSIPPSIYARLAADSANPP